MKPIPIVAIAVLLSVGNSVGKTVRFPLRNPHFSFEIPESYTTAEHENGNFTVYDKRDAVFTITYAEGSVNTRESYKKLMKEIPSKWASHIGAAETEETAVDEIVTRNGLKLFTSTLRYKYKAAGYVSSWYAFEGHNGQFFIVKHLALRKNEARDLRRVRPVLESIRILKW